MKCLSCSAEINPKWTHAIDTNLCPFCGETIMDGKLKDLLSNLKTIMDQLLEFPEELYDWLLSNYNLLNTNSDKLINYLNEDQLKEISQNNKRNSSLKNEKKIIKVNNGENEEEIEVISIQDEEKTNEFVERAGIKKKNDTFKSIKEKNKHLKNMVEQIKTGTVPDVEESDEEEPLNESQLNEVIANDYMTSSIAPGLSEYHNEDDLPSAVENMLIKAKNNPSYNPKDIAKLQKMQNKQQSSLQNMLNGGAVGKGGFSR